MRSFILIILFLIIEISGMAQDKNIIYLNFENNSDKICTIPKEQQGRYQGEIETKKYEKTIQLTGEIHFYICKELFVFNKNKSKKFYNLDYLENIKFSKIEDLVKKANKYHPLYPNKVFNKIYIVEKISAENIVKYEVKWQYYTE